LETKRQGEDVKQYNKPKASKQKIFQINNKGYIEKRKKQEQQEAISNQKNFLVS